ncbi:MAG: branched-chain amino acid ABC transporter permease [Armatimonadota bacterium]
MKTTLRHNLPFLIAIALVIALPLFTRSPYHLSMAVFIGLNAIVAIGLGLLLGFAGQVSLGHAAFYGLGAYGSAILTQRLHLNPWLALGLAATATGLIAYIVGRPTLKLHGHYLAMATLGFGIIVKIVFNEASAITGGPSGLPGVAKLSLGSFALDSDLRFYCLVWPLVILLVLLSRNLLSSRLGRSLRAIHDSEVAARSCAIDTARVKVMIFVLSAVYASVAGSLLAHYVNFVNPDPFGVPFSVELMLMVIIGGSSTIWGPLIGAAVLTIITQTLSGVGQHYPLVKDLDIVLFGLLLILMLLFQPQGLARAFGRSTAARGVAARG